ncbi:hypothetical protein RB620_19855 [Paenibacillus sp. LHD-117]|uniref:hypothetical protein n=1 Tax=Paenibacillus sp. LHD-117 TaxID=3071412 RepID=UPI0027DF54F2|nr:hypothetical protein [Paenibacillus sp. LHD-117]MDQ6421685.1 hypothetical protein [Paenibacillus sp. LHD-117]
MSDKFAKLIKKEVLPVVESALKSGANNFGRELLNAVEDGNQPSDIVFGNIVSALRSGVIATGQQVVKERLQKL